MLFIYSYNYKLELYLNVKTTLNDSVTNHYIHSVFDSSGDT